MALAGLAGGLGALNWLLMAVAETTDSNDDDRLDGNGTITSSQRVRISPTVVGYSGLEGHRESPQTSDWQGDSCARPVCHADKTSQAILGIPKGDSALSCRLQGRTVPYNYALNQTTSGRRD